MSKTALITGAAAGIGYELSIQCAKDNYNLILVDKDEKKLLAIKENFKVAVTIIALDLSAIDAADKLWMQVKEKSIDVLINNAGYGVVGKFVETDWERERDMIHLHILTLTRLTKLALKEMIKKKQGKILNVSSIAAFSSGPLMAIYYASKAYILSFSEAIANEVKGTGVTVTALCPGFVRTDFQKTAMSKQRIVSHHSLTSSPEKVAKLGYRAMQKGKVLAVPGFLSKLIVGLERLLPRIVVTTIIGRLQRKNQK